MKRYRHYTKDKAIVLSCFGSIIEQNKYENLKTLIEDEFSECDVFLAFGSRMVLKYLDKQGHKYKNLPQTLADVDMAGYKNIIVASINLFPTDEHEVLKNIVKGFNLFSPANLRYTDAILTKTKYTTNFLQNLNQTISKDDVANLYVIHGTPRLDTQGIDSISYSANLLEYLDTKNFTCSLEGAMPYFAIKEALIQKIKKSGYTKVQVVPMLLVSGNHYIKDMQEITDELNQYFDTNIVPSVTKSEKFNLIEIDEVVQIIKDNIKEEIIKLG